MSRFLALFKQNSNEQDMLHVINLIGVNGGQIMQSWGGSAIIGEASPELQSELVNVPGLTLFNNVQQPDIHFLDINETATDLAGGWLLAQAPDFQNAWNNFWNGNSAGDNAFPVDNCGGGVDPAAGQGLVPFSINGLLGFAGNQLIAAPLINRNRRSLAGTIGVTVLRVDGPAGSSAVFSPQEWMHALLSLSKGIEILQTLSPSQAHLVFDVDIRKATINLDPNLIPFPADPTKPTAIEYEQIESMWRNPALAQFGAAQSLDGYGDLVRSSKFHFNIDWGFVFVLTKYRAAFPGYAPHFQNVVISYIMEPDLSILPVIFAHEIGHTSGALDEYGPSCSPFHLCGFTKTPNLNCEIANPLSVDCLMKNMKPVVCLSTRNHFGWGDQDNDGVLDPFDPDFITI